MQRIYKNEELVKLAKRDNNKKRTFLLVNSLQGKHIPMSPIKSLELFKTLFEKLTEKYPKESFLIIGFAETATAIGAAIAVECPENTMYIQTTREIMQGSECLFFSEVHSHATEQKMVKDNLKEMIEKTDRIIFAEDELTTGNTIWNIKEIIKNEYPEKELKFGAISVLNGMNEENLKKFNEENIECIYTLKLYEKNYEEKLNEYNYEINRRYELSIDTDISEVKSFFLNRYIDSKKGIEAKIYKEGCNKLVKEIIEKLKKEEFTNKTVLVLGTEEFMYPAMITGRKIEQEWSCAEVKFQATTRSPILPSSEENYPLSSRYELRSFYDNQRVVYIYNLKKYDKVIIIHDSIQNKRIGIKSLIAALKKNDCNDISIFQWGE